MTRFPVHTVESAPVASRPFLEGLKSKVGFVPNLAATMAGSPALIAAFESLRSIVRSGTFTGAERETIALATSFENDCSYCMAAHTTFAQLENAPADALEALRAGAVPRAHPRLAALAAFARKLVASRGFVSDTDVEALRRAGFSQEQVLEVLAVVAATSLANHVHNLAHTPVDPQFRANEWKARPVVEAR